MRLKISFIARFALESCILSTILLDSTLPLKYTLSLHDETELMKKRLKCDNFTLNESLKFGISP